MTWQVFFFLSSHNMNCHISQPWSTTPHNTTAINLQSHVFPEQRDFNKLLSSSTAHLHRQLQSPRKQRREEPVGSSAVPLQRDFQEQRGGWHGPVKPHIVPAGRETWPLCEWRRKIMSPPKKKNNRCDLLTVSVCHFRWWLSMSPMWETASVPWMNTRLK